VNEHRIVDNEEWLAARVELLREEKEFTRRRDELSRQRRDLPWQAVSKQYTFQGATGQRTLTQLFDGRSQLIVYHFMFPPDWDDGCPHCSFWADNFDGIPVHLNHRDTSFVAISRAPYDKLAAYRRRMGWSFEWLSSAGSDFNYDFGVSFTRQELADKTAVYNYSTQDPGMEDREGVSVFYQDDSGSVYRTYSAYARGIDMLNGAYHFLDLTPKGRDEAGHDGPQFWVRRHDEY
jgi:predicted dithiol-disulfide oxidoreductase (DUF899 family)